MKKEWARAELDIGIIERKNVSSWHNKALKVSQLCKFKTYAYKNDAHSVWYRLLVLFW